LGKDARELGRLYVHGYMSMHITERGQKYTKTFDKNALYSCQYFTGCLLFEYQIELRRIIFLSLYKTTKIKSLVMFLLCFTKT